MQVLALSLAMSPSYWCGVAPRALLDPPHDRLPRPPHGLSSFGRSYSRGWRFQRRSTVWLRGDINQKNLWVSTENLCISGSKSL